MEIKGIGLKPKNMKKIISIFLLIIITFFLFNEFDKVKESSLRVIHEYSLRLSKNTAPKVYSFVANDFILRLEKITNHAITTKTAGIWQDSIGNFQIYEQQFDILKILTEHKINLDGRNVIKTIDKAGGMKRIFRFKNNLIGLFTFVSDDSSCYYASLINLTKSIEFMRGACLPEIKQIDFNGMGGGHTEFNDKLLVAIGTPTGDSDEISNLAQDLNSYYGKILQFSLKDISTPFGKFNKSHIFSIGHRNPQGLINLDDDIYSVEHGPKGGDEINLVKSGQNYGWPLYSFGSKYADGSAYPANVGIKGFTAPIYTFIPSIGISNVVKCPYVLTNRYAPAKCLLIGSLRANSVYVVLLNSSNRTVLSVEQINVGMRVREFYEGELNNDLFITTDGHGLHKIHFENVSAFFK